MKYGVIYKKRGGSVGTDTKRCFLFKEKTQVISSFFETNTMCVCVPRHVCICAHRDKVSGRVQTKLLSMLFLGK